MTKKTYEPVSKGNPKQLATQQHIHTAHSISMFYDDSGKVDVFFKEQNNRQRLNKKAKAFITRRTWDERSERGYMVDIETLFHKEIDDIKKFSTRNHEAISKYSLLWCLRHQWHISEKPDVELNCTSSSGNNGESLEKAQEEVLESKGGSFFRQGGILPSRFDVGLNIQINLDKYWAKYSGIEWGLLEATAGEFVVADRYDGRLLIPISPTLAFVANASDRHISEDDVASINRNSISSAYSHYFARNLDNCPK